MLTKTTCRRKEEPAAGRQERTGSGKRLQWLQSRRWCPWCCREQCHMARPLILFEMSQQAFPLAAGTIALRVIAKWNKPITSAVSTGGAWLRLPRHSAALEVKSVIWCFSVFWQQRFFFCEDLKGKRLASERGKWASTADRTSNDPRVSRKRLRICLRQQVLQGRDCFLC